VELPGAHHDADAVRGLLCLPQDRVEMEIRSEQRGGAPGER
jgi:hypothetical protein